MVFNLLDLLPYAQCDFRFPSPFLLFSPNSTLPLQIKNMKLKGNLEREFKRELQQEIWKEMKIDQTDA